MRKKMIERLRELLSLAATKHIGVWGDCMLDWYVDVEEVKINPEADTPVFKVNNKTQKGFPGGAANTSVQLYHVCDKTSLVGAGNNDIRKIRYMKNGQVLHRIDDERPLSPICPDSDLIEQCDAWVISDYHKGTVNQNDVFHYSRKTFPLVWDCKKLPAFSIAGILKFNLPDAIKATRINSPMTAALYAADKSGSIVVMTRGHLPPIIAYTGYKGKELELPPLSPLPHPFEPSGAGDAFSGFLALFMACNSPLGEAAAFAHIAASAAGSTGFFRSPALRCEILGMLDPKERKQPGNELEKWLRTRVPGPLVVTNGCFDMLHPGHIHLLNNCRKLGGKVLVLINTDESVGIVKGSGKPHMNLTHRIEMLAALESVDAIVPFEGLATVAIKSIHDMIGRKIDFLVKGADNNLTPPGHEYANKVELIPIYGEHSSDIARRITSLSLQP